MAGRRETGRGTEVSHEDGLVEHEHDPALPINLSKRGPGLAGLSFQD